MISLISIAIPLESIFAEVGKDAPAHGCGSALMMSPHSAFWLGTQERPAICRGQFFMPNAPNGLFYRSRRPSFVGKQN